MLLLKSEKEIRTEIEEVTKSYKHILDCYPATIQINAPRALMQVAAIEKLDALYTVLKEKRPKFKCDDFTKLNH